MENLNFDEQVAASVVAGLNGWGAPGNKREREDSPDVAGGVRPTKAARVNEPNIDENIPVPAAVALNAMESEALEPEDEEVLLPYPFFCYRDHSTEADPDPLSPVTPPGRVPNFTAKMHAILSRPDLSEIVCWMPHGRSWRILKPREFEIRVIPTYFEHAKFSSFIRQANGWGFRRITQGRDRNSYYNPLFLRGLPHLCKMMKRPGVAQKVAADPDHEPDLYRISELHPVPEKYTDETVLLQCTIEGGPKARMPIYTGLSNNGLKFSDFQLPSECKKAVAPSMPVPPPVQLTPRDHEVLSAFGKSMDTLESDVKHSSAASTVADTPVVADSWLAARIPPLNTSFMPLYGFGSHALQSFQLPANSVAAGPNRLSTLEAANQLAFANSSLYTPPNVAAAMEASSAASQFAAGFAAATAMSQHQFRTMIESLSASLGSQIQQANLSDHR